MRRGSRRTLGWLLSGFLLLGGVGLMIPDASGAPRGRRGQQTSATEEVDHLGLAAMLLQDGHYDRALAVLDGVELTIPGLDLARYHTLRGLSLARLGQPEPAAQAFRESIAAGQAGGLVHVYLAQALVANQDPEGALEALEQAGPEGEALQGAWLLRARCHFMLEAYHEAWAALEGGRLRFPEQDEFAKQQVFALIELGLFQEAREVGARYLEQAEASTDAYVALAEALRRTGAHREAQRLLEAARLRYPTDVNLLKQLAYTWLDDDKPLAAGSILAQAAELDPLLASEAAECYRRAGSFARALYMNALVPDPPEKAKQRLGLLLELGDFERAAALEYRLSRLGLLEDDSIRYGLAFAHFQNRDFEAAEGQLGPIADPEVFAMANQLRQAMDACRDSDIGCD